MTVLGLPSALQHAAQTRDDGKPSLTVEELLSIAVPTAPELAYACDQGWIDIAQAIAVVKAKRLSRAGMAESETRLEAGSVTLAQFIVEAATERTPLVARETYWLYVFMAWGWRVRHQVRRPSELVEAIYVTLNKPFQLEGFAWMARSWGPKVGFLRSRRRAQLKAWRAYLDSDFGYFSDRAVIQGAR